MILEKIEQVNEIVASFSKEVLKYIDKNDITDTVKLKNDILKGKWSLLTFRSEFGSIGTDNLRIIPFRPGTEWPVAHTMPYMETAITQINFRTYYYEGNINVCFKKRSFCERIHDEWEQLYQNLLPIYKILGGTDDLAIFKEVIFNKDWWASVDYPDDAEKAPKIRALKLLIDPSKENHYLLDLIDKIQDKKFLPELPILDLGIYEDWVKSIIYSRGYSASIEKDLTEVVVHLLQAANFTHGFDNNQNSFGYRSSSSETRLTVFSPLREIFLDFNESKISKEIKETPQYYIAKKMNEMQRGYNGIAHLEMAAVFDEQLKDEKTAWKYLVSAGYWAGNNLPEVQIKIIEQAIYLCSKHGWLEASEVLQHNLNILQS